MNYDNKRKFCYLLSGFTDLEDKKGWTAGLVQIINPTPPTSPTSNPPTLPTGTTPVTVVTGSTPVTGVTAVTGATTAGGCKEEIYKNKQYIYAKNDLMAKPSKSKSAQACLDTCLGLVMISTFYNNLTSYF